MNIKQIENILIQGGIESSEAKIEAKILLKHYIGLSEKDLILNEEFEQSEILIEKALERAKTRKPIQQITGFAHFMGEDFFVNEHVLIPRDETEILVRSAIDIIKKNNFTFGLDIGTGSGCIACMIAKFSDAQIIGVDISTEALQVALENVSRLNLNNKAIFRKSDIFSNVKEGEKFDIIVSNPPYIPIKNKHILQTEVLFDPEGALFASDDDGVEFYEKITIQAPAFLNKGGYLMFELGDGQAETVSEKLESAGFSDVNIIQDLSGIKRVIYARFL